MKHVNRSRFHPRGFCRRGFVRSGRGLSSRFSRIRGITLLEVTATFAFCIVALMGLGGGIFHGIRTTTFLQDGQLVKVRSQVYLNRIMSLNFGLAGDKKATGQQLNELFDDDNDVGTATLIGLSQAPKPKDGWTFKLNDFPVDGEWLVKASFDLDNDGNVAGTLEKSGNLVRISVSFNDHEMVWTIRGKETQA